MGNEECGMENAEWGMEDGNKFSFRIPRSAFRIPTDRAYNSQALSQFGGVLLC